MKILVDMNLTPEWTGLFESHGWHAVHWSTVGDPRTTDRAIMSWARSNGYVVFTHDLDFGSVLAATRAQGPSVIQVRAGRVAGPPGKRRSWSSASIRSSAQYRCPDLGGRIALQSSCPSSGPVGWAPEHPRACSGDRKLRRGPPGNRPSPVMQRGAAARAPAPAQLC